MPKIKNPESNTPEAVIFDLDGTIVHSSPDIAHHLNAALAKHIPNVKALAVEDVEMLIGDGMLTLISKGFEAVDAAVDDAILADVLATYRQAYLDQPVVHAYLYEGMIDVFDDLAAKGIPFGLCTNKTESSGRGVLDHFGLTERFGAIIGGDTTPERKPKPEPLLEALRQLNTAPENAVMIGDSKADFGAARNAGTKAILVDWGYSSVDVHSLGADAVISSYQGFSDVLSRVMGK